jgi:hypothetical protein
MIVVTEKRLVVGTLSTLVGRYSLLDLKPTRFGVVAQYPRDIEALWFQVIDDEGFVNWMVVRGDFIVIPAQVPTMQDIKRVLTEQEVQETKLPLNLSAEIE